MRVLVVSTRWDLIGGSERYAGAVAGGLAAAGLEVGVLTAEGLQDSDAKVLRFEALTASRASRTNRANLRALLRRFAPDVVYLTSRVCAEYLEVLLRVAPLVRFVQDHTLFCPGLNKLHEDGSPCSVPLGSACLERYYTTEGCSGFKRNGTASLRYPLRSLAANLRELELTRGARRVLVASKYMRAELLRAGLDHDLVQVLPYFTRSPHSGEHRLPPATRAFLEADDRPLLLCPARLSLPDKGVDFLLTALGHLRGRAKLVIAGDGPARAWLEHKALSEGLGDDAHFAGWLGPAEVEALYAAATLVLFPSVWNEPFGLVGLEAMAHARPVVAFDVGGVRDWLEHGVTGIACERRDARALAEATHALLDDPERARRMGLAGRERMRSSFSERDHVAALKELFAVR